MRPLLLMVRLNKDEIEEVVIIYVQGIETKVERKMSSIAELAAVTDEVEDDDKCTLVVNLTRDETLSFKPTYSIDPVKIQLTIFQNGGNVITSDIYRMRVEDTLYESAVMPNSEE